MKNLVLSLFAASLLLPACTTGPLGYAVTAKGKVEHVVLVWLKKPGDAADRAKVVAAAKKFQAVIREIQHLSVGQPLPSERPVVDDSFDVGLVMRFANAQDLSTYEKHPVHVQAVKEILQPIAKKLLVYDVLAE
ncbi:MAG: hypothetical protein RL015_2304 [Verrucomicrobiota bacterium]|jgi:hypothetical protein